MKTYMAGAVLSLAILLIPSSTHAASLADSILSPVFWFANVVVSTADNLVAQVIGSVTPTPPNTGATTGSNNGTISGVFLIAGSVCDTKVATLAQCQAVCTKGMGTWNAATKTCKPFCYDFKRDLGVGSAGAEVTALNKALSLTNVVTGTPPATFTEDTASFVVNLQSRFGIRLTGYVGLLTRDRLNTLYKCSAIGAPRITSVVQKQSNLYAIIITGTNFLEGSVVMVDGVRRPALSSFNSSGVMTLTVSTIDVGEPGVKKFQVITVNGGSNIVSANILRLPQSPTVTLNSSPFSATPTSGAAPLLVRFSTRIPGNRPAGMYTIDFGDKTTAEPTSCPSSPTDACETSGINMHTYTSPGTYMASLKMALQIETAQGMAPTSQILGTVVITVSGTPTACPVIPLPACIGRAILDANGCQIGIDCGGAEYPLLY